ncbi:hypothetical protein M0805_003963 [Coniferiporia weirii]|nr:hypothetical protein M0805_003963 [Coniferiporia weirii]
MFKALFVAAALPALAVLAEVVPSEPAPGNIYNEGASCTIQWDADTTGVWTTLNIELMTGSNSDMVHLTTVATLDGTKATSFIYTCPQVTPNSAIYFYQFSTPAAPQNLTWTGRFAIADTNGKTTDPTETTDGIEWGTGTLVNAASASAAPSYLNEATSATGSVSISGSASSAPAPPTSAVSVPPTSPATSSSAAGSVVGNSPSNAVTQTSVVSSPSARTSQTNSLAASSSTTTSTTSGAAALVLDLQARSVQAFVALACTALVFATAF